MSGDMVVGHVSWSPDFKADKNGRVWLEQALRDGSVKLAPRMSRGELVSVDLVKGDPVEPTVDLTEEVTEPAQPVDPSGLLLLGPGTESPAVEFTYTNWKGKTSTRRAVLSSLWLGQNEYHPETQLLVHGYDLDKQAPRTYAVRDISNLKPLPSNE